MGKINVILDLDTGIDDAMALAYASWCKNLNIVLVVSSAGNTSSLNVTKNNINVLHSLKRDDVDVVCGLNGPLGEKTINLNVHGLTGLGDYKFEEFNRKPLSGDVADVIHKKITSIDEKVIYVCLGPATNFAKFVNKYPNDIEKIEKLYFSGGLLEELTDGEKPYLGFNVAYDPYAMEILLNQNIETYIIPSNMGHDAYLNWKDVVTIKHLNKIGAMFEIIFRSYYDRHIKNGIATHDLCAMMTISNPDLFEYVKADVTIIYPKCLPSGVLKFNFNANGKYWVATKVKIKGVKRKFIKAIKHMP